MSIMIKGIDMPINCTRCPCSDDGTRFCRAANKYIPMLSKPSFCPLMEAEERKTGQWRNIQIGEWLGVECTACKIAYDRREVPHVNGGGVAWYFCPECGADMRGEGNGNE